MISNFVFQEPENDPKNVCYLWVFYMPTQGSPKWVFCYAFAYFLLFLINRSSVIIILMDKPIDIRSIGQAFLLQMIFQDRSYDSVEGYMYNVSTNITQPFVTSFNQKSFFFNSEIFECLSPFFSSTVLESRCTFYGSKQTSLLCLSLQWSPRMHGHVGRRYDMF